ncbi:type III secretion T3S chaperone [Candidatus Aerophobetes bacterium]|uniref:Type III secretion T3S chaperone n=1 Tax=Aerophobetes bacterium TaxID=2030807 RepID=A0A2A4X5D6_UNCAE|nr:MAG: type III secretion T3S chaperone [Candidatus Aerophobetes bacterium]
MKSESYPLHQIVLIKKRRLDEAERFLKQKRDELLAEEHKLKKVEEERDLTQKHFEDKQDQLKELQNVSTSAEKIEDLKIYLQTVTIELKEKQEKVKIQKTAVSTAESAVNHARVNMLKKQQEVEKLKLHKKSWKKEVQLEQLRKEGIETDDLGTSSFSQKKQSRYK